MGPHFIHFILRTEAMTAADRRLADEQLGRMAQGLWQLSRGVVEGWRRLTRVSRGRNAGAAPSWQSSCHPRWSSSRERRS
jgi:hypothetical protein